MSPSLSAKQPPLLTPLSASHPRDREVGTPPLLPTMRVPSGPHSMRSRGETARPRPAETVLSALKQSHSHGQAHTESGNQYSSTPNSGLTSSTGQPAGSSVSCHHGPWESGDVKWKASWGSTFVPISQYKKQASCQPQTTAHSTFIWGEGTMAL